MKLRKAVLAFAMGGVVVALAACDQQDQAKAPPPPPAPVEPAPPPAAQPSDGKSATETAREGLDKLREAAEKAAKELQPTLDKAKEQADQLLKDAQPHIDKAKEAAKQLGQSFDELLKRAQEDLNKAAEALDERMRQAGEQGQKPAGDPAAVLVAADKLRADTRAAARAGGSTVAPPYVGVWASAAAECARIDQSAVPVFAVITPTSIRRSEIVCNMVEPAMTNGVANVSAECIAEGDVENRDMSFRMSSPDRLSISTPEAVGPELVRCRLPQ